MILFSFTGHISDEKFKKRGEKSQSWLKKKNSLCQFSPKPKNQKKNLSLLLQKTKYIKYTRKYTELQDQVCTRNPLPFGVHNPS